jgi:hypothetical protein
VIQRHVQDPLAEMILAGDIVDGDRVAISVEGNVLTFNGRCLRPPRSRSSNRSKQKASCIECQTGSCALRAAHVSADCLEAKRRAATSRSNHLH